MFGGAQKLVMVSEKTRGNWIEKTSKQARDAAGFLQIYPENRKGDESWSVCALPTTSCVS